jgi:tetratricopeptide (TPR) repeat protein
MQFALTGALRTLANEHKNLENTEKALSLLTRALETDLALQATQNDGTAMVNLASDYFELCNLFQKMQRWEEALEYALRSGDLIPSHIPGNLRIPETRFFVSDNIISYLCGS